MQENLVIRLDPADPGVATWITVDNLGNRTGAVESGPLGTIGDLQAGRRIVVLVPSADVLLTRSPVPGRGARMLQALPYALEDQLAEDVHQLHFAVGKRTDGNLPVAVLRRSLLDTWLSELSEVTITPHVLAPESLGLPATPNGDTLLIEPGLAQLATSDGQHATLDFETPDELVSLVTLTNAARENPAPMTVYLTREDHNRLRDDLEALRDVTGSLEFRAFVDGPLPNLATNIVSNPGINLLQGAYAPRSNVDKAWRPWRAAAAALLALVAAVLIADAIKISRLDSQRQDLQKEIMAIAQSALPGQRVVDPEGQLRAQINRGTGGDTGTFFPFLDALSAAVLETGESRVVDLNYRGGVLNIRVDAPSVDTLDTIVQKLEASTGIAAEIASAAPEGTGVRGQLRLRLQDS